MTRKLLGLTALVCLLILHGVAGADRGETADNGETTIGDPLRGTWEFVSVEIGGMKIDIPNNQKMTITFDNGKVIMNDGMRREESTYKLNGAKAPQGIDLVNPKNQGGQTMLGIYKIEGETLKIGFPANNPTANRPSGFDAKDVGVMILKRTR